MVRVAKSERNALLLLLNKAVTLQVQIYDHLAAIEELTGHVTGLDEWVRQEAADYDKPEDVKLTPKQLAYMLEDIRREE
jgi:hypothetical protein